MSKLYSLRSPIASSSRSILPITFPLSSHRSFSTTPYRRASSSKVADQTPRKPLPALADPLSPEIQKQIADNKRYWTENPNTRCPILEVTTEPKFPWMRLYKFIGWKGGRLAYFQQKLLKNAETAKAIGRMRERGFIQESTGGLKSIMAYISMKYGSTDTRADCLRRYQAYYKAQVDKDLPMIETLSMDDLLKRGKTIAKSSIKMKWEIVPLSTIQRVLSYAVPFVFSRDPKIMWARTYEAIPGLTICQVCVRFDTDQLLSIQRVTDTEAQVRQRRVIENTVFEMRYPGQEAFKMKEVVEASPILWTLDPEARKKEVARMEGLAKAEADKIEAARNHGATQAAMVVPNNKRRN